MLLQDTMEAYNTIKELRNRALKGEDFGQLAQQHSNDPSAKTNYGDLGYFSAFRMVYPFESAAYNTLLVRCLIFSEHNLVITSSNLLINEQIEERLK